MKVDIRDYKLPDELDRYSSAIKELVRTELQPLADEIEHNKTIPYDRLMPLLSQAGLLTLRLPREYGGSGLTFSQFWPILAEVAKSSGSIRMFPHAFNNLWVAINDYGTKEQKKKFSRYWTELIKPIAGCLTEPNAGTGVDIKTTAQKVNGHWVINGIKHLITFADIVDYFFVTAYTGDRSLGPKGISILIVPRDAPGLTIEPHKEMMGIPGLGHAILHFDNCEIPQENILGKEGQGLECYLKNLDPSRLQIATVCLGHAERLLELSIEFAKKRVTFGKPIAQRQAIQQMLGEMAVDIYATKTMIADCARRYDAGESITKEAACCKAFGLEMAGRVSDKALLIHGGIGYTASYPVQMLYKDIRGLWFEEGTPTIQKLVIARSIMGEPPRSIDRR